MQGPSPDTSEATLPMSQVVESAKAKQKMKIKINKRIRALSECPDG